MTAPEEPVAVPATPAPASRRPWALLAVTGLLLAAVSGLGGYIVGERTAEQKFIAANPDSPSAIAAGAAKAKPAAGGTRGPGPVAKADGTYNAQIFGSAGPLEKAEDLPKVHRRNAEDPFAIGPVDAPVVISEFSDFECPFCARYATQTEDTLIKEYVDRGLVRIEWNDMPINGPAAMAGAKAGRAAAEQGKFYEFKHALYAEAAKKNGHPEFGPADYERFAAQAGVPDMAKFKADAASTKYDHVLEQAKQYGGELGVNGTPGFLIGTKFISGAQPTEVFKKTIDQQLAATTRS
ncbi:thioredoxin domain-containing protein [Staphylococcus chromogenes]|nr:thioredoxin domain-containing protein [Staphylococcus chromogenes]